MNMRLLGLLACSCCFALAVAGEANARVPCGPVNAKTLTQGAETRLYFAAGLSKRHVMGCTRGTKRRALLGGSGFGCSGSSSGCGGIDRAAVAGRFAAYSNYECCGDTGDQVFRFSIRDLRTGRRTFGFMGGASAVERATLHGLTVRHTGSAAWVWSHVPQDDPGAQKTVEIYRSPGCGPTVLDQGPDIDSGSLRRAGARVTWRRGGVQRSAALC